MKQQVIKYARYSFSAKLFAAANAVIPFVFLLAYIPACQLLTLLQPILVFVVITLGWPTMWELWKQQNVFGFVSMGATIFTAIVGAQNIAFMPAMLVALGFLNCTAAIAICKSRSLGPKVLGCGKHGALAAPGTLSIERTPA